ncbi:hypothetical protein ACVIOG_006083 [Rhizobium leguminosarum]
MLIGLDVEEGDRGLSAMAGPSTAPRNSVPVSAMSILTTAGEAGKNAWDSRLAASADNEPLPADLRSRSRHQLLGRAFCAAAPRRREAGRPPLTAGPASLLATLFATVNSDMQNKIDKLLCGLFGIALSTSGREFRLPCLTLPCLARLDHIVVSPLSDWIKAHAHKAVLNHKAPWRLPGRFGQPSPRSCRAVEWRGRRKQVQSS